MSLCKLIKDLLPRKPVADSSHPLDLKPYLHKYVAIYNARVVSSGETFSEAMDGARDCKGAPLIFYVSERTVKTKKEIVYIG